MFPVSENPKHFKSVSEIPDFHFIPVCQEVIKICYMLLRLTFFLKERIMRKSRDKYQRKKKIMKKIK